MEEEEQPKEGEEPKEEVASMVLVFLNFGVVLFRICYQYQVSLFLHVLSGWEKEGEKD